MAERNRTLFGRRIGKPLSARRQRLMNDVFPVLRLDTRSPSPSDIYRLFPVAMRRVVLEIGFGAGEHLTSAAASDGDTGFIGVEPFVNGMASAVAEIDRLGLRNVRLFDGDAGCLMDWLPAGSIVRVELLYPDPWPKRRHRKRRFVSPANLDRAARLLTPGGSFVLATDVASYAEWSLVRFRDHPAFRWTAREADDWRRPFAGWTRTRYEAKALAAARRSVYLHYERL